GDLTRAGAPPGRETSRGLCRRCAALGCHCEATPPTAGPAPAPQGPRAGHVAAFRALKRTTGRRPWPGRLSRAGPAASAPTSRRGVSLRPIFSAELKDIAMSSYLLTSESVSEGHPDKIADQISDAVLDAILAQDKRARVACETMVKTGAAIVAGEVTTTAW